MGIFLYVLQSLSFSCLQGPCADGLVVRRDWLDAPGQRGACAGRNHAAAGAVHATGSFNLLPLDPLDPLDLLDPLDPPPPRPKCNLYMSLYFLKF